MILFKNMKPKTLIIILFAISLSFPFGLLLDNHKREIHPPETFQECGVKKGLAFEKPCQVVRTDYGFPFVNKQRFEVVGDNAHFVWGGEVYDKININSTRLCPSWKGGTYYPCSYNQLLLVPFLVLAYPVYLLIKHRPRHTSNQRKRQ